MIVNRLVEGARWSRLGRRLLARRCRAAAPRPPLVLVPSILGTRLESGARGRGSWSRTRDLYLGPGLPDADARAAGLLEKFPLLPGIFAYDVYGGLVRFLERVGGYVRGEDLFVLDYDWRTGIADAAVQLDALVARIRGIGDDRVDLVGISTGGLVARAFLAYGGADPLGEEAPTAAGSRCVRRVVYVGTPQRGSLHVLEMLHDGVRPAPWGRRFAGGEIAALQTAWDCLPHPDERVFLDEDGAVVDADLYDPDVWSRFGLLDVERDALEARLDRARRLHRALDRAPAHAEAFVIGGRDQPTTVRMRLAGGRAEVAPCRPRPGDRLAAETYRPGDGSVPESSVRALPGVDEARFWWCRPVAHHRLPSDPTVHGLILEALLATGRAIPPTVWRPQFVE